MHQSTLHEVLITANLDHSDFSFFSGPLFLLHTDFYEYQLVAFGIDDNFFPPNKAKFA